MKISGDLELKLIIAGAVVLGFYVLVTNRALLSGAVAGATGIAVEAAGSVVLGVGDGLGVPRTNDDECEACLREGRYWDASFACPAKRFIGGIFGG